MRVCDGELDRADVVALLRLHLDSMRSISPPESTHALDLSALKDTAVSFWTLRDADGDLMGCGAMKDLGDGHGEIKSMRTAPGHLRKGVAAHLLEHLIAEAAKREYRRLSLETGSMVAFEPARRLYSRYGFDYCAPFGSYKHDPNSVFMTLLLAR